MSLFTKAEKKARRLKMYIYGESGTGKTVTSLHFPSVALVDTEKGTEHYGDVFDFNRIQTSDPTKVEEAIDELLLDPNGYKTFVIDPFIKIYENIVNDYIKKQIKKTGNKDYELIPRDYKFIKARLTGLIDKLLSLDMNIIVTTLSKTLYSDKKDDFMKVIGTAPDGPKQMPPMFDVVLELKTEDGKHMAYVEKDRTNRLPAEFEFSYKSFTEYIGITELEREAVVFNQQKELDSRSERSTEIEYKGKKLNDCWC